MSSPFPLNTAEEKLIRNFCNSLHGIDFAGKWTHPQTGDFNIFEFQKNLKTSKTGFADKIIQDVTDFRLGNFTLKNDDWKQHIGQGLMFDNDIVRNSTPAEDRNITNIMLLGINYDGPKYAERYVHQAIDNGLLQDAKNLIVHNLSSDTRTRSDCARAFREGDLNFFTAEAKQIVTKYIIPRITDSSGRLNNNVLTGDSSLHLNFICHSNGAAIAYAVENSLRDALLLHPEAYGLNEKLSTADADRLMQKIKVIATGASLVNPLKESEKNIPSMTSLYLLSSDDILMSKHKGIIGAQMYFDDRLRYTKEIFGNIDNYANFMIRRSPFGVMHDKSGRHKIMMILPAGKLEAKDKDMINVTGHGFGFYLKALQQEPAGWNLLHALLETNSLDVVKIAKDRLFSNAYDEPLLSRICDKYVESEKVLLPALLAARETKAWTEKKGAHPRYGEIFTK